MTEDEPQGNPIDEAGVQALSDWLLAKSLEDADAQTLLRGFCNRLVDLGMPLVRGHVALRTLHPMFQSQTFTWHAGAGPVSSRIPHGSEQEDQWLKSPLRPLVEAAQVEKRHRLDRPGDWDRFPMLVDLAAQGMTEYVIFLTPFREIQAARLAGDGMLSSWTTDRPGGFTPAEYAILRRLVTRLAVGIKLFQREQTAANVVAAYLGADAGRRVLDGQITLGAMEVIPSVIWFSDMRMSTALADRLDRDAFRAALNAYFACTAGAVLDHGGDVLRFVGDAVLAIFPIAGPGGAERAARMAVAAARDAVARLDDTNRARAARGEPELDFGLALHAGDLQFGNIGVPERVEFSVIGSAANEAARLESLTKPLARRVIVSDTFAEKLPLGWESLGRHGLRGVGNTHEVFALPQA